LNMKKIILRIALVSTLAACGKVPLTGRRQMELLPESTMREMAATNYKQVINEGPLSKNQKDLDRVKNVGLRISAAVENYMRNNGAANRVEGVKWEFNVIDKAIVNAWCMPGGKVAVYTGIMPLCPDDFSLATVLSHEIAHAIARHGNERMSQGLVVQTGEVALASAIANKPKETQNLFLQAYGASAQLGVLLPYSRLHETEADKMGLIFMAIAGYEPGHAVDFWKRMAGISNGSKPPEILSTHPSDETRIKNIQAFLPEARKYMGTNGVIKK
jgi:predicted Zn-dependent protease